MKKPFRLLALWQPWATLAVSPDPWCGGQPAKGWETRHFWPPGFDGDAPIDVAIHATKKMGPDLVSIITTEPFKSTLTRMGFAAMDPRKVPPSMPLMGGSMSPRPLPLGAIIGVGRISAARTTNGLEDYELARGRDLPAVLHGLERKLGNYTPDRFAWRLTCVEELPTPIPYSATQDVLRPLSDEMTATLDRMLPGFR